MEPKNLKLIAKTEEDLRVVSAHLQDSIASVSDIATLKKNKIFLMQLSRFMWEDVEKGVFRKNTPTTSAATTTTTTSSSSPRDVRRGATSTISPFSNPLDLASSGLILIASLPNILSF